MSSYKSVQHRFSSELSPKFWGQYTQEMTPVVLTAVQLQHRDVLPTTYNRSIVIIETQLVDSLAFTIYNSLLMTPSDVGLELYVSDNIMESVRVITKPLNNVKIIRIQSIHSSMEYHRLLTSAQFWRTTKAREVLLVGTDCLLVKPPAWTKFNQVQLVIPTETVGGSSSHRLHRGLGAGRLSFRDVTALKLVIERYPYEEYGRVGKSILTEDEYFLRYLQQDGVEVATAELTSSGIQLKWDYHSVNTIMDTLQQHYLHLTTKQPKQDQPIPDITHPICHPRLLASGSVLQFGTNYQML
jgi:hypothetical protein